MSARTLPVCAKCGEAKEPGEFRTVYQGFTRRGAHAKPATECKACQAAKAFPHLAEQGLARLTRPELHGELVRRYGPMTNQQIVSRLHALGITIRRGTSTVSTSAAVEAGLLHVLGSRIGDANKAPVYGYGPKPAVLELPPGIEEIRNPQNDARTSAARQEAEDYFAPQYAGLTVRLREAVDRAAEAMREWRQQYRRGRMTGWRGESWAQSPPNREIERLFERTRDDRLEARLMSIAWARSYLAWGDCIPARHQKAPPERQEVGG